MEFSTLEYFSVEPETYLFDGKDFGLDGACVFGVFKHQNEARDRVYILGSAFLQNYYTIYDQDNRKVGIALHPFSSAAVQPTFSQGMIAFIAICVVIFFPLILFGIYTIQ